MDFSNVSETMSAFPAGRYKARITAAEAKNAKNDAGDSMIALTLEIIEGEYARRQVFDNIMTTGNGAGFGKKKMRGIIGDQVETLKMPDAHVCQNMLIELVLVIDVGTEPMFTKDPTTSKYTKEVWETLPDGSSVRAQKNVVKAYYHQGALNGVVGNTGVTPTANQLPNQLPQQQLQPVQQLQQPMQQVPMQGYAPQAQQLPQQQFIPQPQMQPQMQFSQPAQNAPQGYAPPVQGQVPQGFAPQGNAAPNWIGAQLPPGSLPGNPAEASNSKRGKKASQ